MQLEETIVASSPKSLSRVNGGLLAYFRDFAKRSRITSILYSFADQAFAVGGTFLANVVLARTQTKQEYGMFTLAYSIFTLVSGLHNSGILEPCTVYGSGRYRDRFPQYLRLIVRVNVLAGLILMGLVLGTFLLLRGLAPRLVSISLLGLGLTVGILLSGALLRRIFYLQRQPALAAQASLIYFVAVALGLWLAGKARVLNGFCVFGILALGWITAGLSLRKKIVLGNPEQAFLDSEPDYWREHWKYSKWVFASALVFQITSQGYYWLLAGFLSVKEVAEFRAMYLLVAPMDQIFIALSLLFLPVLASHYAAKEMGKFTYLWKRFSLGILGITVIFALSVRIFGKSLVHALYAGRFDGLLPVLYIMTLTPLVMGIGTAITTALNSAENPRFVSYAFASSGAMTFLAGVPLVRHLGIQGAAYGMLVSAATCTTALSLGFLLTMNRGLRLSKNTHA